VRNVILEVLNRMPHSETLKPYVVDLMKLSMHVAATDNEENALIALRIIFDLHKNYRPNLEDEVQPFLDFVVKVSGVSRFVVNTGGFGVASDRRTLSSCFWTLP
jgi:transformation/transcription domain-associated protein